MDCKSLSKSKDQVCTENFTACYRGSTDFGSVFKYPCGSGTSGSLSSKAIDKTKISSKKLTTNVTIKT